MIPADTDVLITHGPPYGIKDYIYDGSNVGCEDLAAAVARIKPRLHVFGHIHEDYGQLIKDGTHYVNACNCTLSYKVKNEPIIVELTVDVPSEVKPAENPAKP